MKRLIPVLIVLAAGCDRRASPAAPAPATPPAPEAAWEARRQAALAGDGAALWASLSADSRARLVAAWAPLLAALKAAGGDALEDAAREARVTPEGLRAMTPETWVAASVAAQHARLARDPARRARLERERCLGAEISGATAVCRVSGPAGESQVRMVLEDAAWKVVLPNPGQ